MNEKQIEAFRAVMIGGSTIKAAQMLNVSQPAVTRLIAGLESSIKIKLFSREQRRLRPTTEAISFFNEVEHFFMGMKKLKRAAEDIRNSNSGHLRIVCLPSFAMGMIPKIIHRFRGIYPSVTISLQVQGSETMMKWFSSQQFNVGLGNQESQIPGVETELFADLCGVCVLPPGHFLAEKSVIRPRDLNGLPFVSSNFNSPAGIIVEKLFEQERVNRVIVMETLYASAICSSVLEGLGVSIINPLVAYDYENRGLVIKPFEPAIYFKTTIHYPIHPKRSQFAETFVTLLKERRDQIIEKCSRLMPKSDVAVES